MITSEAICGVIVEIINANGNETIQVNTNTLEIMVVDISESPYRAAKNPNKREKDAAINAAIIMERLFLGYFSVNHPPTKEPREIPNSTHPIAAVHV